MADKKITALDDLGTALAKEDLFHIVDDPSNTPVNKRVKAEDVFKNIPSFIGLKEASEGLTHTSTAINVTSAVSEVDQSGNPTEFLSNGFKLKNNGGYMNGSGRTYIYLAFAEHPLVSSNGDPATAR